MAEYLTERQRQIIREYVRGGGSSSKGLAQAYIRQLGKIPGKTLDEAIAFEKATIEYVILLDKINDYIADNSLDYNDTWDDINQLYDDYLTGASDIGDNKNEGER